MQNIDPNVVIKKNALQKADELSQIYRNPKYGMLIAGVIREVEGLYKISSEPDPIVKAKLILIDYIKNIDLELGR